MIKYRELANSETDLALLKIFHDTVYIQGFQDSNELVSLDSMILALNMKTLRVERHFDNVHIVLALDEGIPVGGIIFDYLADPNTGVIEFIVVDPNHTHEGIGKGLLVSAEMTLQEDAHLIEQKLDYIIGETKDPFKTTSLKPIDRLNVFKKWGFHYIDFPYVQPALSAEQQALDDLILLIKSFHKEPLYYIHSEKLGLILYEYIRFAMGREDPNTCPEYQQMASYLAQHEKLLIKPIEKFLSGYKPTFSWDVVV